MLRRKTDTPDAKAFWDFIDETAKKVEDYPEWKRGGSKFRDQIRELDKTIEPGIVMCRDNPTTKPKDERIEK